MSDRPEQRFDQLWKDHAPAVVRYARRHVLPDEVEDVVAETFVVAWRRLEEVPPFGLPWLLGVARNVAANARRSRRRQEALSGRIAADLDEPRPGRRPPATTTSPRPCTGSPTPTASC